MEEKKGLVDSLKDFNTAHSSKKVAAWAAFIAAAMLSYKGVDDKTVVALVLCFLAYSALCFGLTNIKELEELKNGKKDGQS